MKLRFIKEVEDPSVKDGIAKYAFEYHTDVKTEDGFTDIKITDEEIDSLVNKLLELKNVCKYE